VGRDATLRQRSEPSEPSKQSGGHLINFEESAQSPTRLCSLATL